MKKFVLLFSLAAILLAGSGCFRVSSDTRALRDAALESTDADEKIEIGVGFFTLGAARMGTRFLDLPPEARTILASVKSAECSVYDVQSTKGNPVKVLARADKSMDERGYDRVVGIVNRDELIAVYVPRSTAFNNSAGVSILVLNKEQLICVKARGDVEALIELGYQQMQRKLPARSRVASTQ